MKTVNCPVIFEGRKFFGIRQFDCRVVSLHTERSLEGLFFTVIPISSSGYLKENPTKARVEIEPQKRWTVFKVYDDYGHCYRMEIHNSLSEEIEFAKQKAEEINKLTKE